MTTTQEHTLDSVHTITEEIAKLHSELSAEVARAKGQGASWTSIGAALGISKQAAQQKYGPKTSARQVPAPGQTAIIVDAPAAPAPAARMTLSPRSTDTNLIFVAAPPAATDHELDLMVDTIAGAETTSWIRANVAKCKSTAEAARLLMKNRVNTGASGPATATTDAYQISTDPSGVHGWFGPALGEWPGTRHRSLSWTALALRLRADS